MTTVNLSRKQRGRQYLCDFRNVSTGVHSAQHGSPGQSYPFPVFVNKVLSEHLFVCSPLPPLLDRLRIQSYHRDHEAEIYEPSASVWEKFADP